MLFYVIKYLIDFCFIDIRKYVHSLKTILHVSIESSILTIIQLSILTTVYQKDPKQQNLPQLCFHPMSSIPWICSSLRPLLGLTLPNAIYPHSMFKVPTPHLCRVSMWTKNNSLGSTLIPLEDEGGVKTAGRAQIK